MNKQDPKLAADKQDKRSVILIELADVDQWLEGSIKDAQALLKLAPCGTDLTLDILRNPLVDCLVCPPWHVKQGEAG
ncbi:hypothetical protein [Comamonas sp. B-9]|uniref:hypothetical protein n=1 Tax=Comamonas sp. B-9 TaxID=1055192 RepID=UPI0011DCB139|nr:hypothetical protein [Comamonas sp. B-9]